MNQLKLTMEKLRAIRMLKLLKETYTYEELSRITGLPITVLNRYVRGKVLPSGNRARELAKRLSPYVDLRAEVLKRLKLNEGGFFDALPVLSDTVLMSLIGEDVVNSLGDLEVEKILTAATDGIPVAVHIARELGVPVVYAKKKKEVGVESFYEVNYVPSALGSVTTLYLPRWALKKNENVLIVDDVIRSGETQRALIELCHQAGANLRGLFVLISVGDALKKIGREMNLPAWSYVEVEEWNS